MRKRVLLTWLTVAALIFLAVIPSTIESALAAPTATAGGGSSDFLLKVASGVSGPPSQWFWDPVTIGGLARAPIGGATSQAPAIAQYNKQFQIMALGTDGQVWQAWYDSTVGVWYPWVHLPAPSSGPSGGFTSAPSVTTYNGQFHVVVRGGSTNHLWHAYYDPSSGWHGWEDLTPSGAVGSASAPAVASYTGSGDRSELHVFYVSDDSSKNLMEMVFNKLGGPANSWTTPVSVGAGPWASAPAATQYGDQLQLWAVLGADHHLYQYFHGPSGGFAGPYGLSSDVVGSAPAVAQYKTQFQVWYVMGDVGGSTVTKQAYYDSATGAWTLPFVWGSMSSAPAITTFGTEFQVWWRQGSSSTGTTPTPTATPAATATPSATNCPGTQSACIQAVLTMLNADRSQAGVGPLTLNTTESNGTSSCVGSYGHSVHMSQAGSISHDQFPADICIPYSMAAENVGEASYGNELTDLQQMDSMMMAEPHDTATCGSTTNHACNTINPAYHQVGIGIYFINNTTWLTEDFTN